MFENKVKQLIEQIKDLSGSVGSEPESVDTTDLLEEIADVFEISPEQVLTWFEDA